MVDECVTDAVASYININVITKADARIDSRLVMGYLVPHLHSLGLSSKVSLVELERMIDSILRDQYGMSGKFFVDCALKTPSGTLEQVYDSDSSCGCNRCWNIDDCG